MDFSMIHWRTSEALTSSLPMSPLSRAAGVREPGAVFVYRARMSRYSAPPISKPPSRARRASRLALMPASRRFAHSSLAYFLAAVLRGPDAPFWMSTVPLHASVGRMNVGFDLKTPRKTWDHAPSGHGARLLGAYRRNHEIRPFRRPLVGGGLVAELDFGGHRIPPEMDAVRRGGARRCWPPSG